MVLLRQLIAKFEGCHHDVLNETAMYRSTDTIGNSPLVTTINIVQIKSEPVHEIFNNVVCATSKASDQPAHTPSLIRAIASRLSIL